MEISNEVINLDSYVNSINIMKNEKSWNKFIDKLKILIIFSCPINITPLRLQYEEKIIRESLNNCNNNDIELVVQPACTIDDLMNHLLVNNYHIIHFSGHIDRLSILYSHLIDKIIDNNDIDRKELLNNKRFNNYMNTYIDSIINNYETMILDTYNNNLNNLNDITIPIDLKYDFMYDDITVQLTYHYVYNHQDFIHLGIGSLAFESRIGQTSLIPPNALTNLLSNHKSLQCIVINACSSIIVGSLIHSLTNIPMTICYNNLLADQESIAFSQGFYSSIALGYKGFKQCYEYGIHSVELKRLLPGMPKRYNIGNSSDYSYSNLIKLLVNDNTTTSCIQSIDSNNKNDSIISDIDSFITLPNDKSNQSIDNEKLNNIISYGMELLKQKDDRIDMLTSLVKVIINSPTNSDTINLAKILLNDKKIENKISAYLTDNPIKTINKSMSKSVSRPVNKSINKSINKSKQLIFLSTVRGEIAPVSELPVYKPKQNNNKSISSLSNSNRYNKRFNNESINKENDRKTNSKSNVKIAFGYRETMSNNQMNKLINRIDQKVDKIVDCKIDSKIDSKIDNKPESSTDNKSDSKIESKVVSKIDNKMRINSPNKPINRLDLNESPNNVIDIHKQLEQTLSKPNNTNNKTVVSKKLYQDQNATNDKPYKDHKTSSQGFREFLKDKKLNNKLKDLRSIDIFTVDTK